jgi:antibiotic biosynthesis monooxygenase (ABM) superfamily enzyme
MNKSAFQVRTEERTRVAGLSSNGAKRVRPDHKAPPQIPRWVKILVIVAIVLLVLFLILRVTLMPYLDHLNGHAGFEGQMPPVDMLIHGGLWG